MGDLNSRRGRIQGMDTKVVCRSLKPRCRGRDAQLPVDPQFSDRCAERHMGLSDMMRVPAHLAQKVVQQAVADGRVRTHEEE
jgi:hypothetical protein